MTATFLDLALYAGGLFILFLTPGPVMFAVVARTLSGGARSSWPFAAGVAVGDVVFPLLAVLGVSWIAQSSEAVMPILKLVATAIFIAMGIGLIRKSDVVIDTNSRLTRPGMITGFAAGVAVIIANPKAILFYMGVLPGFFDLTQVTAVDIIVICFVSAMVPFLGNVVLSLMVDRVRPLLRSPKAMKRVNIVSGLMLIGVGLVLPFI